jgi:hypothetical protein
MVEVTAPARTMTTPRLLGFRWIECERDFHASQRLSSVAAAGSPLKRRVKLHSGLGIRYPSAKCQAYIEDADV